MPRANRHFISGYIWHITHRCHKKEFLLGYNRDKENWIHWLIKARRRYKIKILNYVVTSNHIHLLLKEGIGQNSIASSMQLVAGRTAQEFNKRKNRKGAFWEDRYHATAVESGMHLNRCLLYIDLNMVRAGTVLNPEEWRYSGYSELMRLKERYSGLDIGTLKTLLNCESIKELKALRTQWIINALKDGIVLKRNPVWSESIAVGREPFLNEFKRTPGAQAYGNKIKQYEEFCYLKDEKMPYFRKNGL